MCAALLLLAVYLPPLSRVLQTEGPGVNGWLLILGMSLIPTILGVLVPGIRFYASAKHEEENA